MSTTGCGARQPQLLPPVKLKNAGACIGAESKVIAYDTGGPYPSTSSNPSCFVHDPTPAKALGRAAEDGSGGLATNVENQTEFQVPALAKRQTILGSIPPFLPLTPPSKKVNKYFNKKDKKCP